MKFSKVLFLLFPIIASSRILEPKSVVNVSFLNGSWIQMYSSKYVQESTEIDWNCVTVEISVNPKNNNVNITKSAILHDSKNLVTSQTRVYNAINGVDSILLLSPILGTSSSITPNLALKYINDNYIIITGMDYLTMFIIVRDYETFIHVNDDDALQLLKSFNYTTYYKYPNLSFSSSCLN